MLALGVVSLSDFEHVVDDDLVKLGMTIIQARKLKRVARSV